MKRGVHVTKEQINAMLLIEKKHLERFDHILSQNDDFDSLKQDLKTIDNLEIKKNIRNEILYFKNTILPLRRKERAQIVKAISLLNQMMKDFDDLTKLKKLSKKFADHLDEMDKFKQHLYDSGHNIWS